MGLKFWKREKVAAHITTDTPKDNKAPRRLGPYHLVSELGRGSMGVVYLGRANESGHKTAIKVMTLAVYINLDPLGDALEQFMREARILAWLDHPDVVAIHDAGEDHGVAFIAMEIINGVKLTEFTKPGTLLPVPKVLEIVARVADVLGYTDEQNIAHRDIKPGNIMFDESRNAVKVMDFGISHMTHANSSLLNTVQGSPRYMSPEQAQGKKVDGRSDLFSLGIVLYQMMSGGLPFDGDNEHEVITRIVKQAHVDILDVRPNLPAAVRDVINRTLQKDLAMRYRNGHEMAEAIRRCAASL